MNDRDTCRRTTCSEPARDVSGYEGRFCSTKCELKHEHVKADAEDARRQEQRGSYKDEPHPEEL